MNSMRLSAATPVSRFGDLVHSVFQWLLPEEQAAGAASYTLRRHASEVKKADSVPPLHDFLSRYRSCLDCKWALNPRERPDAFLCGPLVLLSHKIRDCVFV
jgi:hypothetical protein